MHISPCRTKGAHLRETILMGQFSGVSEFGRTVENLPPRSLGGGLQMQVILHVVSWKLAEHHHSRRLALITFKPSLSGSSPLTGCTW